MTKMYDYMRLYKSEGILKEVCTYVALWGCRKDFKSLLKRLGKAKWSGNWSPSTIDFSRKWQILPCFPSSDPVPIQEGGILTSTTDYVLW